MSSLILDFTNVSLIVTILSVLLTWYLYSWYKFKRNMPRFPGIILPVVGNKFRDPYEKAGGEMKLLEDQRRLKSDAVCLYGLGLTVTIITDYKLLHEVFVINQQKSSHRPTFSKLVDEVAVTNGVIMASGRLWQLHRKESLIALRKLGLGVTTLENKTILEADALVDHLSKLGPKVSIDSIKNAFATATSNIVYQLCFGKRFVYGDKDYVKLLEAIEAVLGFAKFDIRFFLPKWIRLLPLVYSAEYEYALGRLVYAKKFIVKEIELQGTNVDDETILGILRNKQKAMPNDFTEEDIMATCLDFLLAGTDTTSVSLTWVIHFMNNYPDVQKRVKQEVKEVLNGKKPESSDINRMPILNALILETLRYAGTVAMSLYHRIVEDITTSRGYILPKGTHVTGSLFAIMRDRNAFKYPDTFDLRNFLTDDLEIIKHDNFIPFSTGPRICAGEKLAKLELFIFIASFIQNFTVSAIDGKCRGPNDADLGIARNPLNYEFLMTKD